MTIGSWITLIISSVYSLTGTIVFILKPNRRVSWGILISHCGLAAFFIYPNTIYAVGAYLLHLSFSLFREPDFFKDKPLRYAGLYLVSLGIAIPAYFGFKSITMAASYAYAGLGLSHLFFHALNARYTSKDAMLRQRAKLLLAGLFLSLASVATAAGSNIWEAIPPYPFLILAAITIPMSIGYGVLRYNLFEVDEIIKRTVLYLVTLAVIAGVYGLFLWAANVYLEGLIFSQNKMVILAVILFFLFYFKNLKRPVQFTLDRIFYRKKADYQRIYSQVRDKLSVIMDIELLTDTVKNIAREDFFVEDAEVLLKDPEQKDYHSYNQSVKIPNQAEIIKLVQEKKQLISHDELLNDPQFQSIKISSLAQMARIEAAFLQPIFYHDEMIAILCLGRLKSGASLNLKDITFLGFLANQTGVALENAKLYDSSGRAKRKLEELNLELEQKVKERTGEVEKRNLQLEETNEKIANATQHKAEFLSSMSHELRTPLNGILGFSDLILEGIYGKIPERVSGTLAYLKESGTTLLLIINNILDLSKIEAGKLEILAEEFEAKEMMEQQLKEISIKAEAKKIKLASSFSPNLPPAWADSKRTRQIITNLLSNAISYTNKGNIEINVSSNKKEIDFEIKDSGIGISSDRMKMIFNEFEKPETYLKKIHKGAGLGLPLSKKLAELQGGKLTIKSRQGKGTVFNLILPAKQQ